MLWIQLDHLGEGDVHHHDQTVDALVRFFHQVARTSLAEWAGQWRKTHLVAASTQAKYDHYLDQHILPAFGQLSFDQIRRSAVKQWAIGLRARYSLASVRGIVILLSLLLTASVEERVIAINPIQGLGMAEPRTRHPTRHRPAAGRRPSHPHQRKGSGHRRPCRSSGRAFGAGDGDHCGVHRDAVRGDHRPGQDQLPPRPGSPADRPGQRLPARGRRHPVARPA